MRTLVTLSLLVGLVLVTAGCQQSSKSADVAPAPPPGGDAYAAVPPPAPEPILTPAPTPTNGDLLGAPIGTQPTFVAPATTTGGKVGNNYVVQRGDTLWSIARKVYGNGQKWQQLASANGISDPSRLRVGQTLVLP